MDGLDNCPQTQGRRRGEARNAETDVAAASLFDSHARRQFGSTGLREVRLDVYTAGTCAFSYTLVHAWKSTGEECRSLLYLIEPKVMLGTVVLLVETPARPDIDICLRLRTSAKPIRVGRSHVGDFVLGTDFTYEDLRFWLPSDDFAVFGISHCVQDGREAWVLDVKRHSDRRKGSTMRIRVDASLFAPRKIEWFSSEVSVADKIYEAKMFRLIDAVWCPTVMTVSRPGDGYLSIMTLQHASHGLHLDDDLFTCEYLPRFDAQALMKVARGPSE